MSTAGRATAASTDHDRKRKRKRDHRVMSSGDVIVLPDSQEDPVIVLGDSQDTEDNEGNDSTSAVVIQPSQLSVRKMRRQLEACGFKTAGIIEKEELLRLHSLHVLPRGGSSKRNRVDDAGGGGVGQARPGGESFEERPKEQAAPSSWAEGLTAIDDLGNKFPRIPMSVVRRTFVYFRSLEGDDGTDANAFAKAFKDLSEKMAKPPAGFRIKKDARAQKAAAAQAGPSSAAAEKEQEEEECLDCECCFDDVPFMKMVSCHDGHLVCRSCLEHHASNVAFGGAGTNYSLHPSPNPGRLQIAYYCFCSPIPSNSPVFPPYVFPCIPLINSPELPCAPLNR